MLPETFAVPDYSPITSLLPIMAVVATRRPEQWRGEALHPPVQYARCFSFSSHLKELRQADIIPVPQFAPPGSKKQVNPFISISCVSS
jgi:hypothetical protein